MKRIVTVLFLLTLAAIAFAGPAAAAPANDNLADAVVITGRSGSISGSNAAATAETDEWIRNAPGNTVWYSWTPTRTGRVTFDTCTYYGFDTTLVAFTGSGYPLARIVDNDDACGTGSIISFDAAAGQTYRIQVDGYSSATGSFTLSWSQAVSGPANDDLDSPAGLLAEGGTRTNTNVGGTKEEGEAAHAGHAGGASVWYSWTAPRNGAATIEVDADFDTLLAVYTQGGTGHAGLVLVAENDDRDPGVVATSAVSFTAYAGQEYLVAIDGKADAQGSFDLAWGLPPANDGISSSQVLDPAGETVLGSNRYATVEVDEPDHAGVAGGASVWFSWTAPYDGWIEVNTAGSDFDTLLHLYERTGDGMAGITALAGNDDVDAERTTSLVRRFVNGGTTYLIAVDGKAGATGAVQLNVGQAPAADLLAQADQLAGVSGSTPTVGAPSNVLATAEDGEPAHAGQPATRSVWYRWQASDDGRAHFSTSGAGFDTVLGVYTQPGTTAADLVEVTSNDDVAAGDTSSAANFITSAGTTYYVAVDGKAGASGSISLQWRSGPVNDEIAFARVLEGPSGTVRGTAINATASPGDPTITDWYGGRSVWYRWTAPTTGAMQFGLSNWPTHQPAIRVFAEGTGGTLTQPTHAEWTYGAWYAHHTERFRAVEGVTYLIGVDFPYWVSDTFDLAWAPVPPPVNDDFDSAINWAADTGNGSWENRWATKEAGEPDHAGAPGGVSLWYEWTPTISGTARIGFDAWYADGVAAVYTGDSVDALTEVASNDDRPGNWYPFLRFPVVAGTTYRIAVDTKDAGHTTGSHNWTVVPTPVNDDLSGALDLAVTGGRLTGQDTTGALREEGEPVHAGRAGGASLWYRFTAPAEGGTFRFTARACDGCWYPDLLAGVYTGDGTSVTTLTEVAASDNAPYVYNPRVLLRTTPGETYYVAVDAPNGDPYAFEVTWDLVATPANDDFETPTALTGPSGLVNATNAGATEQAGEPTLVDSRDGHQSVWFSWTAPSDGTAVFETAGSSIRTLLGLFTGDQRTALTRVASSSYRDSDGNGASRINVPVTAGTTYRIAVDGDGTANGPLTLQWNLNPPPANDDLADATLLEGESGTIVGTNVGATREPGEGNHYFSGGASTWFRFVAPYSGAATFTTVGSDNDTTLTLYEGAGYGSLWGRASDDNSGGELAARLRWQMVAGQSYLLAVDTRDGLVGDIVLNYAFRAPAPNDAFESAQVLADAAGSVEGSTIGATTQSGEPCCDGSSVWYTWTAPANGEVRFTTTSPGFGGYNAIKAFTGTAVDGLSEVGYVQNSWYGGSSIMRFAVSEGTTYRVAMYSYYWYGQQYDFVLNYNIGPPEHDGFAAPRTLSGTSDLDTSVNLGATAEAGEPAHAGAAAASSVWFTWTAPATGSATVDLAGSTFDTRLSVYTGEALDALTEVAANGDAGGGVTSSLVAFEATAGTTYRIAVDGQGGAQGGVRLALDLEVPELSIDDVTVDEGAGTATFTVTRANALHLPASVHWASSPGSATAGVDYTSVASGDTPLSFAAGETAKTIEVPIVDDALDEDGEGYAVSLSGASGAVIVDGWGSGLITDDDLPPVITLTGGQVTEGHSGTTSIAFTASLSAPSGRSVSAMANSANGTAFAPSDYLERLDHAVWFAAGQTDQTFTITVNGDTTDEDDQTFTVALSAPSNATLPGGGAVATGTILDDDPPPDVTIADAATVTEVAGGVNANFTVRLSARSEKTVQVAFATADGTALVSRGDYATRTGTLSFAPGETSKVLTVNVLDDIFDEFDQSFTVELTSATNANLVDASGTATIVDDDATPTAAVADVTVTEGGAAGVAVTLSAPSEKPVRVAYATGAAVPATEPATTDTGALGGADHAAATGTLAFVTDDVAETVTVATNTDTLHEYDETFGLTLTSPEHVDIADGHGVVTITNDDAAPALSVADDAFVEGDDGTTDHVVEVALSAPSGRRVSVAYGIAGGTATATADYRTESGTLHLTPGDQIETVVFGVVGDLTDEHDQTAQLTLTAPVDATLGRGAATLTISDDDEPPVVTMADAGSVTESSAGAVDAVFTATLSRASEKTISLGWFTVEGTALASRGDFTAAIGVVTFVAGDTTENIVVAVTDDVYDEFDQNFAVILSDPVDVTIGDGSGLATIVDDDATPTVSISDASATEGGLVTFDVTTSERSEKPITVGFATGVATPATEPATTDGSALGGADHPATSGTLAFAQDEVAKTVSVESFADGLHEYDETFGVTLGDVVNVVSGDGHGVGTILDDDTAPSVSVADVVVTEGHLGSADHAVEVALSSVSGRRISVAYDLAAGTATVVDDFTARAGTLAFAPGDQTETVTFTVVGDGVDEYDQTAVLTLSAPLDVTLLDPEATLTITDDDLPPSVAFTSASPSVDEPTASVTLTAGLDLRSEKPITVPVVLDDVSASAADHGAAPASIAFPPGVTSTSFDVAVVNDTTDEPDQRFRLTLQAADFVRSGPPGGEARTVTIVDDDLPPLASITDADSSVDEGAGPASATVRLSEASEWPVTVTVAAVDVTTSAADHGSPSPAPVAFPLGSTEQVVSAAVVGDTTDEPDQAFRLELTGGDHVRLDGGTGNSDVTFTIIDDDAPPAVTLAGPAHVEESQGTAAYQVSLSAPSEKDVTVSVALTDTTTNGLDHGPLAPVSPVVITAGSTGTAVTVDLADDDLDESDETFTVSLSSATNGTLAGGPVVTAIVDDDATPVAGATSAGTDEDTATAVALSATDADGGDLTYTVVTAPAFGSVTVDGAVATYTPAADANGTDSFTYVAGDGTNTSAPATVTVTVRPVNDAPTAAGTTVEVAEDGTVDIDLAGLVGDRETADTDLVLEAVAGGGAGTATIDGLTLRYAPNADVNGADSITLTVTDRGDPDDCGTPGPACAGAASAEAVIAVTVTPVNDVPTAAASTVELPEDAAPVAIDLGLLVGDVETGDDGLAYEIVAAPTAGELAGTGRDRTYTPAPNANGTDSFAYRVTDAGDGAAPPASSETRTVTLRVAAVNDLPVAGADEATTNQEAGVTIDVLADDTDVEGIDPSTLAVTTGPAQGTATVTDDHRIRYQPATDYSGADSFTYRICDTDGACTTALVDLTVLPNRLPVTVADAVTTDEDVTSAPVLVLTNDSDPDGHELTVTASTDGALGTVVCSAAGSCVYTPAADAHGRDSFSYTVSDGHGGSAVGTVSVSVTPVQDAPVAGDDAVATDEDSPTAAVAVLANDTDVDGDTLEVSAFGQGAFGSVGCTTAGSCRYTPAADAHGTDSFTYTVRDGHGGVATGTVTVTVAPVDDRPVATADAAMVAEDGSADVDVVANDTGLGDGGITVTEVSAPAHGAATVVGGRVRYVPAGDFHGADSFTYTVADGDLDEATATVTITVTAVNDAPVAASDAAATHEDTPVSIDVLANDTDVEGDDLTVTGHSTPARGTVTCTSSSCTYTPAADAHGADSFTYTVRDGQGGSTTGTVSVEVSALSASGDLGPGGTLTSGAGAPTPAEPVAVAVTSPTGGTVTIDDRESTTAAAEGYSLFGVEVVITAPAATAADPLRLTFTVDGSKVVPPASSLDAALAGLAVFRNGTLVGSCPGSTTASPDPCIAAARLVGGDLEVTVLTSRASTWTLGVPAPAPAPVAEPAKAAKGYWIAAADGAVMSYGGAPRFGGSIAGQALNHPVVGIEATPTGQGYWLVARDGGVFAFGDAGFHGSTGALRLNQPIVGMASTPSGQGYWLVASDGGIFAFGDAGFHGSTGAIKLNKPIVGMETTPTGRGYWLVATDGGIFSFGDAGFFGSTGAMALNKPIVGMTTSPTGQGYWLVASDGGIFTFGDTSFFGSTGDLVLNQPIIGMSSTPSAQGYWLVARDGGLFTFGDAAFHGAAAGILSAPAIGAAW